MSRFDDFDPATYKGEELDGFTVNGQYFEHRIFTRTDDRIDCLDEEGNLVLRFTANCYILKPDGSHYGHMRTKSDTNYRTMYWYAEVDSEEVELRHPDNLKLEVLVSERYVKKLLEASPLTCANHYTYLDAVIEDFWKLVFDKTLSETGCAGIVVSHGDKCEQYKHQWEKNEVPYKHGALLYLLTYTSELGDTPKPKSCEWVIENYPKYKDKIIAAEESFKRKKAQKEAVDKEAEAFQGRVNLGAIQHQLNLANKAHNGRIELMEERIPLRAITEEAVEVFYAEEKNLRYIFKDGKEVSIIKKRNFFRKNLKNKYRIEISVVQDGNLVEEHHFYPEREKEALKAFYHVLHGIPEPEAELSTDYRFTMDNFYGVE